jgi:hypothetical protein
MDIRVSTPLQEVEMILRERRAPLKKFESDRIVAPISSGQWRSKSLYYPVSFRKIRQKTDSVFASTAFRLILPESSLNALALSIDQCCPYVIVSADTRQNILVAGYAIHPDTWSKDMDCLIAACDKIQPLVDAIRLGADWNDTLVRLSFFPYSHHC